jgi:hypothetical protein
MDRNTINAVSKYGITTIDESLFMSENNGTTPTTTVYWNVA